MKKSLLLISLFSFFTFLSFGMDGDGSPSNPFRGTLSSSDTWSIGEFSGNTVYIGNATTPDLTITTGGHLTIDPGITVIFTQLTSDLFITGTGQLTAGGAGSAVTFTKDTGKSHWGHISFQNMGTSPVSSTFNNCILEYGYSVGNNAQPLLAGGAIQIDFDDVVITNCIFRYNYANYAGAIMVNSNRNTIIRNSYFESNDSYECGGAMILYANSTTFIENCIFENNHSMGHSSTSYSGGAIWSYSNTSKIVNCTFVENNSDRAGDAIYSYSSSNMRIINSILWGSSDQFAGSSTTLTIVTCAFETSKPSNAGNSIIISNVASDHFVDAGSSDWTLKFISPCRDAGVNSYTGVTIPSTDYNGDPRISTKDIGAYEVQYSRWTGTTSTLWSTATNWDQSVDPSSGTGDVVIPTGLSNYPTGSTTQDYTIASGKQMIIEQGAKVTLDDLTNNGSLTLESGATDISSLITASFSGNDADIELFLSGGGTISTYKWHYISSPISTLPVSTFTGVTLDIVGYAEPRVSTDLVQGWVAWDGYVYATGGDDDTYAFSNLTPGKGYDYWNESDYEFTLSGQLNVSNVPVALSYGGTANSGFNLLGNPFSSGLNWDDIINGIYYTYPASTSKGLYFTRDNTQCSYVGGVGIPSDVTGIIPPMQGFFVKTSATGQTINLPPQARTHDNIHARYKGKSIIPLIRLAISENTMSDETVVRFDELAKSSYDYDFDALKIFDSQDNTGIYTFLDNTKYAINGLPFPDQLVEIPVVINLTQDGIHTIDATQLQGLDLYNVYLVDNSTGFIAELKSNPVVTFSASPGLISDRFIIKVSNIATSIEDHVLSGKSFNIYQGFNLINIQPISEEWDGKSGSVRILDMAGKTITDVTGTEFSRNSVTQVRAPSANGLYLVEIRSGLMRYVGKVVVK